MSQLIAHIRIHIIRGFLAVIPILLCVLAVLLLQHFIDQQVMALVSHYVEARYVPGLGVLLLILALMLIGYVVTNVINRRILRALDRFLARIPFIGQVYLLTRQISDVLGKKGGEAYKKTVLVNYPNQNQWTIGFFAGRIKNHAKGVDLLKVYIPHAHPVIGFVYLAEEKSIIDPGWSVHDGLKMVITLGLVAPPVFHQS